MKKFLKWSLFAIGISLFVTACGNVKTEESEELNKEIIEEKMENNKFNNATPEQLEGINKALESNLEMAPSIK